MQCPICKTNTMNNADLLPNLTGAICDTCKGTWISRSNYDAWQARQPGDLPETTVEIEFTITDTHKAKLCPQCRHLLLPYRVGHGLPFSIDYCGTCGGVWFDPKEWEAIKAKNLHDNLHEIVSAHWQTEVRKDEVNKSIEQTYRRLLGPAYDQANQTRDWLRKQTNKALILAYLAEAKPEKS